MVTEAVDPAEVTVRHLAHRITTNRITRSAGFVGAVGGLLFPMQLLGLFVILCGQLLQHW